MNTYYENAYALEWDADFNGNLSEEEITARLAEWLNWIDTALPMTREIYNELPDDQKYRYGNLSLWKKRGGLEVVAGGVADRQFTVIDKKYKEIAAQRAYEARKAAGWSGERFLTAPNGTSRGPTGQHFGRFTLPGDEHGQGMWDGDLQKDVVFTV